MNQFYPKTPPNILQETKASNDTAARSVARVTQRRVKSKAAGTMAALLKAIPSLKDRIGKLETTKEGHVYFFLSDHIPNLLPVACNDDDNIEALIDRFSGGGKNA
jgi:hypothetical protein